MDNKSKLNKNFLVVGLFVLLFLIPLALVLIGAKPTDPSVVPPPPVNTGDQSPADIVTLNLVPSDVNWAIGKTYDVDIELDESMPVTPDYVEIIVTYDPEVLTLDDTTPGNLWTEQNVLIKSIDNEAGTLKLVFGKALESEETKLKKVTTLTFTTLDTITKNTAIILDPGSNAASSLTESLINLSSQPLLINVGQ